MKSRMNLFLMPIGDIFKKRISIYHLSSVIVILMTLNIQTLTYAGGDDMKIFDKIENIENSAIDRNKTNQIEVVPINDDVFLSEGWTMDKILDFYSQNSGLCKISENLMMTCSRKVDSLDGRFQIIISFKEKSDSIQVIEYVAIGVK